RPGKNVLAVEANNFNDFFTGQRTSAALLVQLSYNAGGKFPSIVSDKSWKASKMVPNGWQQPDFNDGAGATVKVLGPYNNDNTKAWNNLVWDLSVSRSFQGKAAPLKPIVSGNVRDFDSGEGYPTLEARGGAISKISTAPNNDATFLRYDKASPLVKIGSPGVHP